MDNTNISDFDFYELQYRNAVFSKNTHFHFDTSISKETNKKVMDILKELPAITPQEKNEIRFSDVVYELFPKIDNETGNVNYNYVPIFCDNKLSGNADEYIERFNNLDINKLPLIEVAKLMNIKVEKSKQLVIYETNGICKPYGTYKPFENKIILGTDYIPTYIHELAHAVDFYLYKTSDSHGTIKYDENYFELVAELSSIVICKIYSIPIILSYSLHYLDAFSYLSNDINAKQLLHRVSEIVECIKKMKEYVKSNNSR